MSISILEQKLYKSNFKTEEARFNLLFSLHASLTKHKEVPSFYITDKLNLNNLIEQVLLSDICSLNLFHSDNLRNLGISKKYFESLKPDEKYEILEMIEDILVNGIGKGYIHYETLRLMPVEKCALSTILEKYDTKHEYYNLLKILDKRLDDSVNYLKKLDSVFTQGERNYHPSIISKSYSILIEKSWKNNWMNQSNYIEGKVASNILLMEDI